MSVKTTRCVRRLLLWNKKIEDRIGRVVLSPTCPFVVESVKKSLIKIEETLKPKYVKSF